MARTFDDEFADLARLAHRVAYRITNDAAEAEDLAQEAMARALVRWRRIEPYAEAWVVRVVTNLAIGRWRRRRPALPIPGHRPSHEAEAALRIDLAAALRTLPPRQREVITLRYLADLPEARVAELLGCTNGTVKQHTHRGLASLRRLLPGSTGGS